MCPLPDFSSPLAEAARALARHHPDVATRLESRPATLAALAATDLTEQRRSHAVARIREGDDPASIDRLLDVPGWMHAAAPSAMPAAFGGLPRSPGFDRSMTRTLLGRPAADQSKIVAMFAGTLPDADTAIACWVLRRIVADGYRLDRDVVALLGAFIWCARLTQHPASRFVSGSWTSDATLGETARFCRDWAGLCCLHLVVGPGGQPPWRYQHASAGGIVIMPAMTADDIALAARPLGLVPSDLVDDLLTNRCRVMTVQDQGTAIGYVILRPDPVVPQHLRAEVTSARGRSGLPPPVYDAVYRCLGAEAKPEAWGVPLPEATQLPEYVDFLIHWDDVFGPLTRACAPLALLPATPTSVVEPYRRIEAARDRLATIALRP